MHGPATEESIVTLNPTDEDGDGTTLQSPPPRSSTPINESNRSKPLPLPRISPPGPEVAEEATNTISDECSASGASQSEDDDLDHNNLFSEAYNGGQETSSSHVEESTSDKTAELFVTMRPQAVAGDDNKAPTLPPKNISNQQSGQLGKVDMLSIVPTPPSPAQTRDGNTHPFWQPTASNNSSDTSSTILPSEVSIDGSEELLLPSDSSARSNKKKTKGLRFWHVVQKGNVMIPLTNATVITLCLAAYAAMRYAYDKAEFIKFINANSTFLIVPIAIVLLLFIIGIAFAIKQFCDTEVHQIQEKDPNKALEEIFNSKSGILKNHLERRIIKHMILEHSNGTILHFQPSVVPFENGCAYPDNEVMKKTGKLQSLINRPALTALSTAFITANIMLPSMLYAAGGINDVQKFYNNILTNNVGLSFLIISSILALSILCLGVHYFNKTNCCNPIIQQGQENKITNEIISSSIEAKRATMLKENHGQTGKCASLELSKVVIELHHYDPSIVCCA